MTKNASCFFLAYSSPIFSTKIIVKIGKYGKTKEVTNLIFNKVKINTQHNNIDAFL